MYLGLKNGVVAVLDFKLIPLFLGACKVHVREAVAAEESVPAYAGYLCAGYVQALERGAALEGVDPYALDVDAESDGLKVAAFSKAPMPMTSMVSEAVTLVTASSPAKGLGSAISFAPSGRTRSPKSPL